MASSCFTSTLAEHAAHRQPRHACDVAFWDVSSTAAERFSTRGSTLFRNIDAACLIDLTESVLPFVPSIAQHIRCCGPRTLAWKLHLGKAPESTGVVCTGWWRGPCADRVQAIVEAIRL